jgi:hypothetical protein
VELGIRSSKDKITREDKFRVRGKTWLGRKSKLLSN